MYEVELKAHVENKNQTVENLNNFAEFQSKIVRKDKYFCLPSVSEKKIRIREETINDKNKSFIITHKNKNFHFNKNGEKIEMNQEFETTIQDGAVLEQYLLSVGFVIDVEKTKVIEEFHYTFNNDKISDKPITAHLELCNVAPLGEFLEVEILSESQDDKIVSEIQKELYNILDKAGISRSCIENKTYSQMIKESKA